MNNDSSRWFLKRRRRQTILPKPVATLFFAAPRKLQPGPARLTRLQSTSRDSITVRTTRRQNSLERFISSFSTISRPPEKSPLSQALISFFSSFLR